METCTNFSLLNPLIPQFVKQRILGVENIGSLLRRRLLHNGYKPAGTDHAAVPSSPPPAYNTVYSDPPSSTTVTKGGVAVQPFTSSSRKSTQNHDRIRWKHAQTGLALINLAAQEATSASIISSSTSSSRSRVSINDDSDAVSRQQFLQGVTWLLRALPGSLTVDETIQMQSAWTSTHPQGPSSFPTTNPPCCRCCCGSHPDHHGDQSVSEPEDRTILHRTAATLTTTFLLALTLFYTFLYPYVSRGILYFAEYERENQIGERAVQSLRAGATWAGKLAVGVVMAGEESVVGRKVLEGLVFGVQEVVGGIVEGVRRGR